MFSRSNMGFSLAEVTSEGVKEVYKDNASPEYFFRRFECSIGQI
jgi:hypothetical protein